MQSISLRSIASTSAAMTRAAIARFKRTDFAFTPGPQLTPYPDVAQELDQLDGELRLNEDLHADFGTLGYACKSYWRAHCLRPRTMELPAAPSAAEKLAQRRLLLGDVCHVLLGFSRNWTGQLSLYSYLAAQHYCPEFDWSARRVAQFFMTAAPWFRDDFADAEAYGRRLALKTPRLLTMPLEQDWNTPLPLLRDRLNIRWASFFRPVFEPAPAIAALGSAD
jgi:hypothetical protein